MLPATGTYIRLPGWNQKECRDFNDNDRPECQVYTVQAGDIATDIAAKYKVGFCARVRGWRGWLRRLAPVRCGCNEGCVELGEAGAALAPPSTTRTRLCAHPARHHRRLHRRSTWMRC